MSLSDIKLSVQNPAELEGQRPRQKTIALWATSRLTDFWRPDLVYMQYAAAADIQFICLSPEDRNDIAINFIISHFQILIWKYLLQKMIWLYSILNTVFSSDMECEI